MEKKVKISKQLKNLHSIPIELLYIARNGNIRIKCIPFPYDYKYEYNNDKQEFVLK